MGRIISENQPHIPRPAFQLVEYFNCYLYNRPNCPNDTCIYDDIPLQKYALESIKAHPKTALHKVLYDLAYNYFFLFFYDDMDWVEEISDFTDEVIIIFNACDIQIPDAFKTNNYEKIIHAKKQKQSEFLSGLKKICASAFDIIFKQRQLLYDFNLKMSSIIKSLEVSEYPELEKDGKIKRLPLPKWLKDAITKRDFGRCQTLGCGEVIISPSLSNQKGYFDHMVPLAEGGTNDATNFQLLCESCNKKKSANLIPQKGFYSWPSTGDTGKAEYK